MAAPKIVLYTNHACPWAHRAHIALRELNLPYSEEIIDLSLPRTPAYLALNPRGLVPALTYNSNIITESAIVAHFLADAHPSHLLPPSAAPGGALRRARIAFFIDTFMAKVHNLFIKSLGFATEEEERMKADKLIAAIARDVEPLLADAGPFFGGAQKLTLAEVQTGSFILRLLAYPKYEGLLPASLIMRYEEETPNFWKWANAVVKEESVNYIWDEAKVAASSKAKIDRARAATATAAK
ncbi:thioredoxin-like protein [Calycina marina]|uniref:Thioredoxin-like protein n=1 Tax=Calycina marina TaxID=1763456 RepID=A0A9P8CIQ1_9HELO|nr:thioredoxin-like protein [Calycina marina]